MAFNFNWSPLTADAGFYTKAQELLTSALNKSPKPPIIVDDILVNELNLGHVPPELEILEVGDLAEDRFRGIFKMSYNGDAFLTLKTKVQANPLNTYLLTRPTFASPKPLAAATGLTIPLQITLSDIKLSAFIVLVFSRQKGLTLVFRNDPLESLKVSSTFDSIPFVRDYLQKEIEGQLRILLMDELPAIIHRLSLRLWVPEYSAREDPKQTISDSPEDELIVDPFKSLPQDPVDSSGNVLNRSEIESLSLDSGIETQSLFSRKNLLHLATLTDSHRTLSLFTPSIRDVVFRAWAGSTERGEFTGSRTPSKTPLLSRTHSYAGSISTTYSFAENGLQGRPGLPRSGYSTQGLSMGAGRNSKAAGARKRKKRVVNLRRKVESGEIELISEDGSTITDSGSVTSDAASVFSAPPAASLDDQNLHPDPMTPPMSPNATVRTGKSVNRRPLVTPGQHFQASNYMPSARDGLVAVDGASSEAVVHESWNHSPAQSSRHVLSAQELEVLDATPRASMYLQESKDDLHPGSATAPIPYDARSSDTGSAMSSKPPLPNFLQFVMESCHGGSIAQQAWIMKVAGQLAKRYQEEEKEKEKEKKKGRLVSSERDAPPAYAQ